VEPDQIIKQAKRLANSAYGRYLNKMAEDFKREID